MSFGESSRTEVLRASCINADSYVLIYGGVERIDTGKKDVSILGALRDALVEVLVHIGSSYSIYTVRQRQSP